MKILIVAQKEFAYKNGQFVGGIQKVEADQVAALSYVPTNHITIFMPNDTEAGVFGEYKNVQVVRSISASQDQLDPAAKAKSTRKRSEEIQRLLRGEQFDCVIVHDWSIGIHGLFLNEFKHVPSIVFLHNMPVDSGGIQMFNRIDTYTKLHKQGSVSAAVSHTCVTMWVEEINRKIESEKQSKLLKPETIEWFNQHKAEVFDVIWPGMIDRAREPQPTEYRYATMISRLNDNKRIDLASRIAHEAKIPLKLFCPAPKNDEQDAIIQSFLKYHREEDLHINCDRDKMFDMLTRSSLHMIPSVESFSLVALEAQSCGVPCLIVDRGYANSPHEACQMNDVLNISYDAKMKKDERQKFLEDKMATIPYSLETRKQLATNISEFYSLSSVSNRLMDKIEMAVQRKNKWNESSEQEDEGIFAFA